MRQRAAAVLALGALLATTAACGARWSDEERAAVHTRGRRAAATSADGPAVGGAGSGTGAARTAGASTGSSSGGPTGGAPSAGGGAVATGGGGPRPCAAPSDAPGVSEREIRVGSISSLSGPVPGLGASSAAATRAYVAFRNSTGGVCGRRIVLQEGDDGTATSGYRALVSDMDTKVLGIAGGFALGDIGGLDVIKAAGLPVVTAPSDDRGTALPTLFDINPPYEGRHALIGKYRFLHDQGVRTATQVYLAVAQSRFEAQRQAGLMEAAGIRVTDVQELPLATLSYDGPARRAVNSGADYLFFVGDARGNSAMARSMQDAGADLRFEEYFTFSYGEGFIEQAGAAAAEGATTWLRSLPNEDADRNHEVARFLEWMDRAAPGVVRDAFAVDGWVGAKAFLEILETIPGPITREALVAQLRSTETYDAEGMYGPIRLGAELNNGCFVGMQVRGGEWRRLVPADDGFIC